MSLHILNFPVQLLGKLWLKNVNDIWKDVSHIRLSENSSITCVDVQCDLILALCFPQHSSAHASTFVCISFFFFLAGFHPMTVCLCFMKDVSSSILLGLPSNCSAAFSFCILQQSTFSGICPFLLLFRDQEVCPSKKNLVEFFHGFHFFSPFTYLD